MDFFVYSSIFFANTKFFKNTHHIPPEKVTEVKISPLTDPNSYPTLFLQKSNARTLFRFLARLFPSPTRPSSALGGLEADPDWEQAWLHLVPIREFKA